MDKRQAELGHPRSFNRATRSFVLFAVLTPVKFLRCGRCVRFRRSPYPLKIDPLTPTAEDTVPDSAPPRTPPLPVCCISHTASHCIWGSERGPLAPYPSHCRNCTAAAALPADAPPGCLHHRSALPRGAPRRLRAIRGRQMFMPEGGKRMCILGSGRPGLVSGRSGLGSGRSDGLLSSVGQTCRLAAGP